MRLYFHKINPPKQYWGYISLTFLKEHLLKKLNCKWDFIVFLSFININKIKKNDISKWPKKECEVVVIKKIYIILINKTKGEVVI